MAVVRTVLSLVVGASAVVPAWAYEPPIGTPLPTIRGVTLAGRQVELPSGTAGSPVIVILGFYRESAKPLEAWARTLVRPGTCTSRMPVYILPMMGDGPLKLVAQVILGQLRRAVPHTQYDKVMPVFENLDPIKASVHYTQAEKAYTLLIDGRGVIRGALVGGPTAESLADLHRLAGRLVDGLARRR